jgi:hypothetical protein
MLYLATMCILLSAFAFYLQWQKDRAINALLKEQALERRAWGQERRELNNRIQVPEAAPFIDTEQPATQHVPFDDDEAFNATREENPEWP